MLPTFFDLGDKIKHIRIQREIDTTTIDKVNSLLDRILSGLAIPKDVAAGLSGVKYSNAIIVEETLYSSHIEPLIMQQLDTRTRLFLRLHGAEQMVSPRLIPQMN